MEDELAVGENVAGVDSSRRVVEAAAVLLHKWGPHSIQRRTSLTQQEISKERRKGMLVQWDTTTEDACSMLSANRRHVERNAAMVVVVEQVVL